jgi:hypothetical protein
MTTIQQGVKMMFQLSKQAKKSGGDKYVCVDDENFVIYIPQNVSRDNGIVKNTLSIFIN